MLQNVDSQKSGRSLSFRKSFTRVQFGLSTMLCTFLNLSKLYNFVSGNHNLRNMSEGEEVLKSRQILAVGCTNKIGKTREFLKSM